MKNPERKYLIPEDVYDFDHPDVMYWTKFFMEKALRKSIFTNIEATLGSSRDHFQVAHVVAGAWYDFTCYVPTFITKAVTLVEDPEWQHHLIQIAYDELGGRFKKNIHSHLFVAAIEKAGLAITPANHLPSIKPILKILDRTLTSTKTRYGILGLLLSFEIIAEQNIEMLFQGLAYSDEAKESLSASPFFKIHRQDESEHIRHSIANYLKFCATEEQKVEFTDTFDAGIDYWQRFWDQMARMILVDTSALAAKVVANEAAALQA